VTLGTEKNTGVRIARLHRLPQLPRLPRLKWHNAHTMSEMTLLLSWIHWGQLITQKLALVGSGLFAGAVLYRAAYAAPPGLSLAVALRQFREASPAADRSLAALACATALAAATASLTGAGLAWLVAALAEALAGLYLITEIRRTRRALAVTDPAADALAQAWLARWHGQNRWLAIHAAWVPWLLVFQI